MIAKKHISCFSYAIACACVLLASAGSTDVGPDAKKPGSSSSPDPPVQWAVSRISPGSAATLEAYGAQAERYKLKETDFAQRMKRLSDKIVRSAKRGKDTIADQRGFFWRGYRSKYAQDPQLYSIYIPRKYDPSRKWPLIVSLHGGSSNHNVWMAMILGNAVPVSKYRSSFRSEFRAFSHQNRAIIVAPQGLGQNHWLWSAEQDVLDVIEDVKQNYNIDENRIVLNGLSNGAIASYKIGLAHAWRFAGVLPMSGIVDWESYDGSRVIRPAERTAMGLDSPITLAENAYNTYFKFYHGVKDTGFKVSQARRFARKLERLAIPFKYHEIANLGHHLTHILWRDLQIVDLTENLRRKNRPSEVRLVTGSERSNRQFWIVHEDRIDHQSPARIRARAEPYGIIHVETRNVRRFTLLLDEAPVSWVSTLVVDGQNVNVGPGVGEEPITLQAVAPYGDSGKLLIGYRAGEMIWQLASRTDVPAVEGKTARLSGPIGDANFEPQIHVYGTGVPQDTAQLRNAARMGARGWVKDPGSTQVSHPVVPDTELTPDMMRDRVLVLYGNAKNNAILAEIGHKLPIRVGPDYIELRDEQLYEKGTGTRFVCPNPLMTGKYLVVQAGVTAEAVERAGTLPAFLGDYVVFDKRFKSKFQRLVLGGNPDIESGFFTEDWRLPPL